MRFRVIDNKTGKEADTYDIALHEEWAKNLIYCDMEGFAITDDGDLILTDECGNFVFCDTERFKVVFEVERPHGEWVESKERKGHFYCSECIHQDASGKWRELFDYKYNYCPNCGADMRPREGEAE